MTDYRELAQDEKMEADVEITLIPLRKTQDEIKEGQRCIGCLCESCCCTCEN